MDKNMKPSLMESLKAALDSNLEENFKERIKAEIEKMEAENRKRKEKAEEKANERKPIIDKIVANLSTSEYFSASTIKEKCELDESIQLISSLLRKLENDNIVCSEQIKNGSKKCKGYKLVTVE